MTTIKETPKEQSVEDVAAAIEQCKLDLTAAEDALIEKQKEVSDIKSNLRVLEDSMRVSSMKDSKVPNLAGKWYRDLGSNQRTCKHYVFVKEDLGFVFFSENNEFRRKLKIVDLFINDQNFVNEIRTEIKLSNYDNYIFYRDPSILKPVNSDIVKKFLARQCYNYVKKMKDFGINLRLETKEKQKQPMNKTSENIGISKEINK